MIRELSVWWFKRSGWRFMGTLPKHHSKVILLLGPISKKSDLFLWLAIIELTRYKVRLAIDKRKIHLISKLWQRPFRVLPLDLEWKKRTRIEIINKINERNKSCIAFMLNDWNDIENWEDHFSMEVAAKTESKVVLVAFDHYRKVVKFHTDFIPSGNKERDQSYVKSFFSNFYSYLLSDKVDQR